MTLQPRDAFTAAHWNGRFRVVIYPAGSRQPTVEERGQALFITPTTDQLWGRLVGAPDDAVVELAPWPSGDQAVRILLHHPWLLGAAVRFVFRDVLGQVAILNEHLHVHEDAPAGVATRLLAHQVREAQAQRVAYLQANAAGGPGSPFNGYYTWARLGFEGPLPPAVKSRLPPHLAGAEFVLDLMLLQGGQEWWRANGRGYEGTFDLREGSRSLAVLRAYTLSRGIVL